jgi:hypothetical protein
MKYDRASKGSRGSASQWNGFLDMHKAFYGNTVGQGLIPPILQSSTIVPATLKSGETAIGAFQPVRLVKNFGFKNVVDTMPSYEVEPVDAVDGERHGNYGFTLGEGVTEANGGRIVIGGLAIVAMDAEQLYFDKAGAEKEGSFDSSYYMVPDETMSTDLRLIAPVGHYKLLSWYDPTSLAGFENTDKVYVALDMAQRPTSFLAKVDATIDASSTASEVITMNSGTAYAYYGVEASTAATGELEVMKDEVAYEIEVYNPYSYSASIGEQLIEYSLELNRFIVVRPQTVKIGKADADIAVDATGTISIWRAGADTTENETASLDWMAGTTQVSSGKEVMITWFADEGIWRITGAECEDA